MDSRLDVNTMGLTSTLVSKLFDNLSNSLDVTLSNLMTNENDRYSVYSTMSGTSTVSPSGSGSSLNIGGGLSGSGGSGSNSPNPSIITSNTSGTTISPTSSTTNISSMVGGTLSSSPGVSPISINSLSPTIITTNIATSGGSGSGNITPSSSNINIPSLNASGSIGRNSLTLSPNSLMSIGSGNIVSSGSSTSSSSNLLSGSSSIKISKGNTLIRKLATSGKILNIDQNETEWTNFARNFWFYYPSLMLISESSKYCKESAIRLVLEYLPKHIQQLQSSSSTTSSTTSATSSVQSSPSQSTTVSPTLTTLGPNGNIVVNGSIGKSSNISTTNIIQHNNNNIPTSLPNSPLHSNPNNASNSQITAGFNFSLTVQQQQQSNINFGNTITTTTTTTQGSTATFTTLGPGGIQSPSSSLSNILTSNNQSQPKLFSFEQFLMTISSYHQGSDTKYLDLIESTVEIVVADIITHILGKIDFSQVHSNTNPPLSMFLINRLRDLAFYYFKPINARSLNFSTWISLRLSISDQWSLILGQISRISLIPISQYLTKTIQNNPPLDDLIPLFKGIRWVSLVLTDSEKIQEVEKLLTQMYNWIDNNKKNVLRLVQLEALDGMLLSMTDYTQSSNIVSKMREIYKKAEKLLKNDEFEDRSSKLMCSIISRGPPSHFEEDYEGIMKRIWKSITVPKKRDYSLECILRLLQGRFVPPRKISGLQTYLSTNTSSSSSNSGGIAAQLQQRLDRVYENSGSYLYAGLIFNRGKVIPRLQEIIQGLFGKKQNIPRIIECIDLLTAISVHISVHSLKLLTDSILPTLFSSSNPLYHVIALRTLSIILDPTGVFWNTAYSANSKSISGLSSQSDNITYVRKEEIQLTFETFLSKSFKYCEEQSGLPSNNSSLLNGENISISQDPLTISTQFEPTISLYSLINESSSGNSNVHNSYQHKFENDTTIDAIKRWYEVCTKSVEQRERELSDQNRLLTISLTSKIYQWEKNNNLLNSQLLESFPIKKKTIRKKTISPDLLELFKETIRCITFIPKNFILHSNLHKLVLHEEEEIASAASHAIQVIMCDHPELRTPLVQGFTSLILQYVGKDHASLQTLLSQLLGLIDLWNERSFIESRHASVPLDNSFFPPKMLETEIEAIGFVHLCSPIPSTRLIALQIIRSISGIRNTEINNTQIASVIHQKWRTISQRARHHLLLDNACGIDKEIKLNPNDDLPSAEELVQTTHDRLWAITLCEIGRMCTEHDCVRTLSKARGILLNIINSMPPVPTESTTDENKRYNNYILRYLWINSHGLLLSISGIASSYPLRPTPQETSQDPLVDEMIKFESNLQGKITQYLPTFWNGLLSDVSWIRDKLSFICGLLHWRLIPTLIDSLNEWWTQNKQNKKLSRVRVDLSNIFRRISQHKDFPRAIFESQDLVQVFVQFIQQIDPIFGDPTKLPSINNESYFNDNAVVVYNFCNSLFTPTLCALNGQIRKSLISSIKSIPWTVGERYKTFKAILQWSGHPNVSQQRMQLEGIEINKKLSKCKDSASREEEKERIEIALRKIRDCSRLAAESILKLGTLFEEGKLQKEVLEWVVDSELKGNRILRWVLSYHFDEAYAYFLSRCYIDNPAESVLYLHSIYDQFLPIPPVNPPTLGITQDIYQYYFDKALEEKDQEDLEDEPVTIIDKQFSRKLIDIGASLLFLSLLNLLHPAFLARIRSFDLIARLSPSSFGLMNEENVLIRSQLLPRRQSFSSRNTPTNKINAMEVSALVSSTCSLWTEKLFEEVFYRFKNLNTQNKKWTIQFLLPWCNNISFAEGRMQRMSPVEFLKQFFTTLTESITPSGNNTEMMPELIDLWLALAKKEPQNLMVIINFLVKKSISNRDHMPICKMIILYIYRMDPERTLEPLIYQLSYSGVSHSMGNEKRLSAGLSDNDLSGVGDVNEVDKNKLSRQSSKIRETCVIILTDLISENLVPVMPYLHIVFNYSILRIDSSTESPLLQKMINILLSGLRNNLYAQTFIANDEEVKQQSRTILKSFDTILTSLRLPTFQIKFDFNDGSHIGSGHSSIMIGGGGSTAMRRDIRNNEIINQSFIGFDNKNPIVSIYSKRKASFLVQGSNKISHHQKDTLMKDSVIDHRNEMIKWCNGYIYADELIQVLCKYFEVVTPSTIDRWENESLYWIKNYKDPRVSIKSCQMYRSIIQCQQQLVNNNMIHNNNLIIKTMKRQKLRWASSVEHLVTLLQEWTEDLDTCLINLTKLSNQINFGIGGTQQQILIKSFNEQQNLAVFKRTLCVEILLTLKQIIQSKNIDENSLSLIFWSSISLIVPTQLFYKPLYETSLEIISQIFKFDNDDDGTNNQDENQVDQEKLLKSFINVPLFVKHILENSKHINIPRGIQYHLFKGLLSPSTEEVCSQLLVCLISIQSNNGNEAQSDQTGGAVLQIDPMGPPQRYLLPILALAPWLHNRILTSKSSIIYREQKIAADKIATTLSKVLVQNVSTKELNQNQELSEIFKSYSQGGFNSNPDSFLVKVITSVRSTVIPKFSVECSDLMTTLLDSSSSLSNSILKVINLLLEGASPQVMPLFKNIIKIACDYGSSLPVAADLINSVVSTMKNSIPQNNLQPLLPPIDKTSSEILKQILIPVKYQQQQQLLQQQQQQLLQQQQQQQQVQILQQQQQQQQSQQQSTSPLSMSQQDQNKKKGHRRNKSPISDHPSLKEKAINEKKSQPISPPQFISNVFNPPSSNTAQQQQVQEIQKQQEEIIHEIEQEIEQDELDLDEFDEFDDEEMKNLMENDPTLTKSMSKSMWRNSDEYNSYLDLDENDLDLEDLKVGLEGLDSNILNKFGGKSGGSATSSKRSSRSLNQSSEEGEEYRTSSRSSRSHSTTSNTGLNKSRSRSSSTASSRDRSSSVTSQPTQQPLTSSTKQPSFNLITPSSNKLKTPSTTTTTTSTPSNQKPSTIQHQESSLGQDSIEALRALLGTSTSDLSVSKRNSDSIQIDQLLNNLKNFDSTDETYAQLESEFDDLLIAESPQASFLNLVSSGSQHSPSSSINSSSLNSSSAMGIKEILNDSKKRRSFLNFLKKQHYQKAVNDVCFVEVVNDFKSDIEGSGEIGGDGLLYLMKHIVEGFVVENSKHSISITDKVREKVVKSYQEFISDGNNIDPNIFDEALDMVFKALSDKSILDAFISQSSL